MLGLKGSRYVPAWFSYQSMLTFTGSFCNNAQPYKLFRSQYLRYDDSFSYHNRSYICC